MERPGHPEDQEVPVERQYINQQPAILPKPDQRPAQTHQNRRRQLSPQCRQLNYHRPHQSRRQHRSRLASQQIPGTKGHQTQGLQHLRLQTRQRRNHDARHLRQHPTHQQNGQQDRSHHPARPEQHRNVHLRGSREVDGGWHPDHRARGPGVRLGQLQRLGGQGSVPAGRQGGHRRELGTHPPLQLGRHGHPAFAVQA